MAQGHDKIEKNIGLMIILIIITVSIGGLVPLSSGTTGLLGTSRRMITLASAGKCIGLPWMGASWKQPDGFGGSTRYPAPQLFP